MDMPASPDQPPKPIPKQEKIRLDSTPKAPEKPSVESPLTPEVPLTTQNARGELQKLATPPESPKQTSTIPKEGTPDGELAMVPDGTPSQTPEGKPQQFPDYAFTPEQLNEYNALLSDLTKLFYDAKDTRLYVTGMARNALPTPIGNELKAGVIRMMRESGPPRASGLARFTKGPEYNHRYRVIRERMMASFPKDRDLKTITPETSPILGLLKEKNAAGTYGLQKMIESGTLNTAGAIEWVGQNADKNVALALWEQIGNMQQPPYGSAMDILHAAGIKEPDKKNYTQLFSIGQPKEKILSAIGEKIVPAFMMTSIAMSIISQVFQEAEGGRGGGGGGH